MATRIYSHAHGNGAHMHSNGLAQTMNPGLGKDSMGLQTHMLEGMAKDLHAQLLSTLASGLQRSPHYYGSYNNRTLHHEAHCSCHVGHFSNNQIIGNLLHVIVNLALFPHAGVDKETQVSTMHYGRDQISQTTPQVSEVNLQCGTSLGSMWHRGVQTGSGVSAHKSSQTIDGSPLVDEITQTDGAWREYATKGVRIGGGYHLFSCPADPERSPSPSPGVTRTHGTSVQRGRVQWNGQDHRQSRAASAPHITFDETTMLGIHEETQAALGDPAYVAEIIDQTLDSGLRPPTALPMDSDKQPLYNRFVHGKPTDVTSASRYNIGAYSPYSQEKLTRRDIAEAVQSGEFQLYRVLNTDQQHSSVHGQVPVCGQRIDPSRLRQGNWRRQRPQSVPSRRMRTQ